LARQKLGQHFLTDRSVLQRIAASACARETPVVVEIGPGKGALTEFLLERAQHVVAVELDSTLLSGLQTRFPSLELHHGDALQIDFSRWPDAPITGNLPYYVATPIISKVVRYRRPAVFLIQKEVAERITAKPGNREYGYFSVEVQLFAEAKLLFSVGRGAFRPPPLVESAVIQLTPRPPLDGCETEEFLTFVSRAFQHKRKMLRNNLVPFFPLEKLAALPELSQRAEQLSGSQLLRLFHVLQG
jgi:16S rRNA (adenine1518-N6/adenine1519-N6)-dimethyltransferase